MGIIYSASIVCDTCKSSLPILDREPKAPDMNSIKTKVKASGWHFLFTAGGLVLCPQCWAERHKMEVRKDENMPES